MLNWKSCKNLEDFEMLRIIKNLLIKTVLYKRLEIRKVFFLRHLELILQRGLACQMFNDLALPSSLAWHFERKTVKIAFKLCCASLDCFILYSEALKFLEPNLYRKQSKLCIFQSLFEKARKITKPIFFVWNFILTSNLVQLY